MSIFKQLFLIIFSIFFLSACSLHKETKPIEEKPIIIEEPIKKVVIKKPKKKIVKKRPIKKKKITYKYCDKHFKIMNHATSYVITEFQNAYFKQNDLVGAKAQLFLIQTKSQTVFAKSINSANESYKKQYEIASKNKCNLKNYNSTPLQKVSQRVNRLEKQKVKK